MGVNEYLFLNFSIIYNIFIEEKQMVHLNQRRLIAFMSYLA
jgi:hypothetical protein